MTATLVRQEHRFDNITLDARNCSTVLLVFYLCVSCDFYSDGIPVPMVTYIRQEVFVSDGKLPQPLFDAIKDNGICTVTQGCRAGPPTRR